MKSYHLGKLHGTNTPFYIPRSSFGTHWHLLGGTGNRANASNVSTASNGAASTSSAI